MKKILLLFSVILLVCSSCREATNETPTESPSLSPTAHISQTPSPTPQGESPTPVELPLPSSETFGLEGVDAVLYDAAAEFDSTKIGEGRLPETDLLLPSLGLLDTYQTEDGSTCYVCLFREYLYYDLAYGLRDPDHPQYSFGGGVNYARFTVSESDDGELICTEMYTSLDGGGWAYSIRVICGPNEELAEAIINNEELSVEVQNITPADNVGLLNVYLDYCFR